MNGNVGVGGTTAKATDSGPSTLNGRLDFTNANVGQFSNNNGGDVISGRVHYNVASVTSALSAVNSLNTTLGGEAGTNVNINGTTTINAASGILDASGDRVFTVTGFNTTNSDILTIKGDGAGDKVVLNFTSSVNFNNQVALSGISSDQVLYNFVGGNNLSGGPTLQINDNGNGHPSNLVQGIFLDPNGPISVTNTNLSGRVFGGDSHDMQIVSGDTITAPAAAPLPSSVWSGLLLFAALGAFKVIGRAGVGRLR